MNEREIEGENDGLIFLKNLVTQLKHDAQQEKAIAAEKNAA